jgi:hypothetical protein
VKEGGREGGRGREVLALVLFHRKSTLACKYNIKERIPLVLVMRCRHAMPSCDIVADIVAIVSKVVLLTQC